MPLRTVLIWSLAGLAAAAFAGCAETPAPAVPARPVPAERVWIPALVVPAPGRVAVDLRRERSGGGLARLREMHVEVDGQPAAELMNGEHVTFYLSPGTHRLAVSTQFDSVVELPFVVDPRYRNQASAAFDKAGRLVLRRVPR